MWGNYQGYLLHPPTFCLVIVLSNFCYLTQCASLHLIASHEVFFVLHLLISTHKQDCSFTLSCPTLFYIFIKIECNHIPYPIDYSHISLINYLTQCASLIMSIWPVTIKYIDNLLFACLDFVIVLINPWLIV